jgi:hypothetical protein
MLVPELVEWELALVDKQELLVDLVSLNSNSNINNT